MRKLLAIALVGCLALLGVAQDKPPIPIDGIAPAFTVANRITASTTAKTFRQQFLDGRRLTGFVVTDGGVAPADPVAAATLSASYGANIVDLQHKEFGRKQGWWTNAQILAFMDAGLAKGFRFSTCLADKLGELYPNGVQQFIKDLYDQVQAAEKLYEDNLVDETPLLKHKAMGFVTLCNEPAHLTTPEKAIRFFRKWAPRVRAINPNLLINDAADAWDQAEHPSPWADVVALHDFIGIHFYGGGEDFGIHGGGSWIGEGWKIWKVRLFVARVRELAARKLQVFIQEFGSYNTNRYYGANEMFLQVMAALEGWSTCMFAFTTNNDGWIGKSVDKYAAVTDPLRLNILLLGTYLAKNADGLFLEHWDGTTGQWGPNFRVKGTKVEITQDYARIGTYLFTWNPQMRWVWLVKPL